MEQTSETCSSDLVDLIIDANGGLDYWNSVFSISTTFTFSGPALTARGFPGHHEVSISIDTKEPRVIFHRLRDLYGVWTPSRTEAGKLGSQEPPSIRLKPRDAFRGYTPQSVWDEHNLIYFVGYAMRYYFTLPFCLRLPGFQTQELPPITGPNDEQWRVLRVEFPDDFPTHTKIQKLFFDDTFRLRQMEYNVDIIGPRQTAHLCFDHRVFGQLIVPTFRFANLRVAGATHMTAFIVQVKDVQIHRTETTRSRGASAQ
ncbi:hypothetical protein H2200_009683 [Cladophialophora chaetospira]|uniref:Uncharacterized protein n=1 Tax=Cladophialophora chaetospira TaxID=386627 RepID=A0AA38X2W3_9EURO|nr:hypothetical protein H2200_009683 [Cladophialophora chaetospira]